MDGPWIPQTVRSIEHDDPQTAIKLQFAALIASAPDNKIERFKAARRLFPLPSQEGMCQQIAHDEAPMGWINDPVVIGELSRLKREQSGDDLPSKIAIARQLLNMAEDNKFTVNDRLKAYAQYCELMELNPKKDGSPAAPGPGNHTYIDNRRMFVAPAMLEDDDWQTRAREIRSKQIELTANKDA
jgi:hypothetical protein